MAHRSNAARPVTHQEVISLRSNALSLFPGKSVEAKAMNDLKILISHILYTGNPLKSKKGPKIYVKIKIKDILQTP